MDRLRGLLACTVLLAAIGLPTTRGVEPSAQPKEPKATITEPRPQADGEAQPHLAAPVTVRDEANRFELHLPGPYWRWADRGVLAAQGSGGCGGPRVPPGLMLVLEHKDALARIWCERSEQPFLMRDAGDLEAFINAFAETVRSQVGSGLADSEASYSEQNGMTVHRLSFTVPVRTGGGCGGRPAAGEVPKMHVVIMHFFVRPKDEDAIYWKLSCMAPIQVYDSLKSEFDHVLGSFRHTGELAGQLFEPGAPQDKVLGAKEGARAAGASGPPYLWILFIALAVGIWLLTRKRKARPT